MVDRHAGRFHQDFDHARRRFGLVPFRFGNGKRIDDKDDDPAHLIQRRLEADQVQRFHQFQGIQHAAHAEVIGHAAIHDMEVGSVDAVAKLRLFLDMAGRARGGPGRIAGMDKRLDPVRRGVVATTAVVVQGDRREHHRHGGRGRRRRDSRTALRSGTQHIEGGLREGQARAGGDIGGRGHDKGPCPRLRSPKVAPLKRTSSYKSAASSSGPIRWTTVKASRPD